MALGNILNPDFDTAGAASGQAASWTEDYPDDGSGMTQEAAELLGPFTAAGGGTKPVENFEDGWDNDNAVASFDSTSYVAGLFEDGTHQFESFEYSWAEPIAIVPGFPLFNHQSIDSLDGTPTETGVFGATDEYEDFEDGWDNTTSLAPGTGTPALDAGAAATGAFDSGTPEDYEDFEEEWDNDSAVAVGSATAAFDLGGVSSTAGLFADSPPEAFEDFDDWTTTYP